MDGTAVALLFLSLAATVAAMAIPPAYPNAPIEIWRGLFWIGIFGMVGSALYLVYANMTLAKIGATFTIVVGTMLVLGGINWFWRASQSTLPEQPKMSEAPLPSFNTDTAKSSPSSSVPSPALTPSAPESSKVDESARRIFVPENITPNYLVNLFKDNTNIAAEKQN